MRNTLIKTTVMPWMLAAALCPSLTFGQQSDPFYGQLMLTAANFCPVGWAEANGQLLPISQNDVLFSLLGTTYGGNGISVFALPDLRGRAPIHAGQGPGLDDIQRGESAGAESITLMVSNLPVHSHSFSVPATTNAATHSTPSGGRVVAQSQNAGIYADSAGANTSAGSGMTGIAGSSQPVQIRNPYLGMLWCIANTGVYPARQ